MKLACLTSCLLLSSAHAFFCANTCSTANNGICEASESGTGSCSCGSDCNDCGSQLCSSCPDGYRTCEKNDNVWCCDRSSSFDRCSDEEGFCKQNTSKKTRKTAVGVVIAIAVIIPLAIIFGILGCCFGCKGCPGQKCLEDRRHAGHHAADNAPVYTTAAAQPAKSYELGTVA